MAPDASSGEIALVALSGEATASGDAALRGYRAVPSTGSGPGVLVLGREPALDASVRSACQRLARAGFVALASPRDTSDAQRALDRGVRSLLCDSALVGARIGVLGFGEGGAVALQLAARERRIGAVVSVEGVPAGGEASRDPLPPALLVFGAEDVVARDAAKALAARQPEARLHAEPGASAGFADERRADRHAALAAARAWDAALAFLRAAT